MITAFSGGIASIGALRPLVVGISSGSGAVVTPPTSRGWIRYDQIWHPDRSGNASQFAMQSGVIASGHLAVGDTQGNLVDGGVPGGGGGGTGTVTSVALTVPARQSVSGSPIVAAGTLAISDNTQSPNLVFAGPTSGSPAVPTFRAIDPTDLPLGSSSAFGAVKVDGTTITATAGVISAGAGALVLLESHTASSSATINFTTRNASGQSGASFQSDFDDYVIKFLNIIPATNNVLLTMVCSTNGGSSWDTTAGHYDYLVWFYLSSVTASAGSTSDSKIVACYNLASAANDNGGGCGSMEIFNPLSTTIWMRANSKMSGASSSNSFALAGQELTGRYKQTGTAVNAVQFAMTSGNIASGIFRLYGIAK